MDIFIFRVDNAAFSFAVLLLVINYIKDCLRVGVT